MTDIKSKDETDGFSDAKEALSISGLVPPEPDSIENFEGERLHRKQRLAAGLRVLGRLRLAEGIAGHVTVRDPEYLDRFWVNPFGKNFKLMTVSDLICVDHTGEVVIGDQPVNAAAFAIHSQLHTARPDIMAAAHCHSMYGKTFSTLGNPLKMITQDDTMFYNDVALCSVGSGAVVLDASVGQAMADALGDKKALIHQNHGLITTGGSVDAAIWWFVSLERSCQSQILAESAGEPIEIPDELAESGYKQTGHDLAGWFQFQPWWEELLQDDPGFLD
ncbi:MAG: class II aldolase/adducin family protein [Acidimicrobiales bacterium]|jgi:ribulose-5-phosphate 4-epimerase/fuculose-1-phosphate aldolase|nr:class II aldolase/adducin family protein [Acidimicrobiales bacterium]